MSKRDRNGENMEQKTKDLGRTKYVLFREYFHYFSGKGALYDISRQSITPSSLYIQLMQKGPQGEDVRLFTFFTSYLEFLAYLEKVPRHCWNFNEMIVGNRPQKLKYDIDAALPPRDGESEDEAFRRNTLLIENVKDVLIEKILEEFPQLRVERDILIYKSDRNREGSTYKASMHIVVHHIAFSDYLEVQAVFSAIKARIGDPFFVDGVSIWEERIIDPSVNSKNQNFRCLGSHKPGKFNTKRLYSTWVYKGQIVRLQRNVTFLSDAHKWVTEMGESLISNVDDCVILPNRVSQEERDRKERRILKAKVIGDGSDELVKRCLDLLSERVGEDMTDCFDVYSMEERDNGVVFIQLKRLVPTLCPICSERSGGSVYHERQNPYFRVVRSNVYFACRRAFDANMRQMEAHLGTCFAMDVLPEELDVILEKPNVETCTTAPTSPVLATPVKTQSKHVRTKFSTNTRSFAGGVYRMYTHTLC